MGNGVQSYKPATVLPFSIGIAATWNEKLVHKVYTAVGDEFRYDESTYLCPFGYGLSYTRFEYSDLEILPQSKAGQVKISVKVKNVGDRKGDAVVEMYLKDAEASVPVPVKQLKGFERVTLIPEELKMVQFILQPDDFSLLDEDLIPVVESGIFDVMIGESSRDIVPRETFEVASPIMAKFEYENFEFTKSGAKDFDISATVIGTGGMEEGEVRLYVNGKKVKSKKVCLKSGERRDLKMVYEVDNESTFTISIGDLFIVDQAG